ncbi:hypothetical protein BVG19_g175 [[Candida] boidinii]|nr:hypothetical protein BVG19_g175 [[Candida] boidinii]OWB49743.1 hypothetical protein B5S27_g1285 [[Candida] boidinii]
MIKPKEIVKLPPNIPLKNKIPNDIIHLISLNLYNQQDLLNFSLINKDTFNNFISDNKLWAHFLKVIKYWPNSYFNKKKSNSAKLNSSIGQSHSRSHSQSISQSHSRSRSKGSISIPKDDRTINNILIDDLEVTPINCYANPKLDFNLARDEFIKIYSILSPIIHDVVIKNYSNVQNLKVFQQFNDPLDQSKLFINIIKFINLYKYDLNYSTYLIRLNTILDIFVNSALHEIENCLKSKNYESCFNLICALDQLSSIKNYNTEITTGSLESLLEFFINRYIDDFTALTNNSLLDDIFVKAKPKAVKINGNNDLKYELGAVKGYKFDFDKIDEIFEKNITHKLNEEFHEISAIFAKRDIEKDDVDEVPIVLKIIETFLSSYLIGGLVDSIIRKSKFIDQSEMVNGLESVENLTDKNVTNDDANGVSTSEPEVEKNNTNPNGSNVWGEGEDKEEEVDSESKNEKPDKEDKEEEDDNDEEVDYNGRINLMNENSLYFQCVPYLYFKLNNTFNNLVYPTTIIKMNNNNTSDAAQKNNGKIEMQYSKVSSEFINFYYEQYLYEFSELLPRQLHYSLLQLIDKWELHKAEVEKLRETEIFKLVDENNGDSKKKLFGLDVFNNFSNIFKFQKLTGSDTAEDSKPSKKQIEEQQQEANSENEKISKIAAKLKLLTVNVKNMKSLVSMDLTIVLLQHVKNSYDLLLSFSKISTKELQEKMNKSCELIFNDMLVVLIEKHIKPGFEEALVRLKNFNPNEISKIEQNGVLSPSKSTIESLNNFIELVNIGDLILTMIEVFYQDQLISRKIIKNYKIQNKKDFLSSNQCDKLILKLEQSLDSYVADGLEVSITIIITEITYIILDSNIDETTYNFKTLDELARLKIEIDKPSQYCIKIVDIFDMNFKLLSNSIEKPILDVFKEEIGERFVNFLIKVITKKLVISTIGALLFINDINYLYSFFLKSRIKPTVQYFVSLKTISQLYLVDCSTKKGAKELGKLVIDIGRDNGIFTPQEVYQFVSRRSDWLSIKKNVDKIMYGFGADDCIIM